MKLTSSDYYVTRWKNERLMQSAEGRPEELKITDWTPVAVVVGLTAFIASVWFVMVCIAIKELFQ